MSIHSVVLRQATSHQQNTTKKIFLKFCLIADLLVYVKSAGT